MGNDLLCQLIQLYFDRGYPPHCLSIEWGEEDSMGNEKQEIQLEWLSGTWKQKRYGFTNERWELSINLFNRLWLR